MRTTSENEIKLPARFIYKYYARNIRSPFFGGPQNASSGFRPSSFRFSATVAVILSSVPTRKIILCVLRGRKVAIDARNNARDMFENRWTRNETASIKMRHGQIWILIWNLKFANFIRTSFGNSHFICVVY